MDLGFKIIAVDFDGTLCEDKFPEIGEPNLGLISWLQDQKAQGNKIILWTCRVGDHLNTAIDWCKKEGLFFDEVNRNIPEVIHLWGLGGPKIYADRYIDDKACIENSLPFITDIGEVSDGHHTFNDLYTQRLVLTSVLFNQNKLISWKSKKHSDGELCFGGGWFIVGIDTPEGPYSYHYKKEYWSMFDCKELDFAPEWDGHTDKDVDRLLSLYSKNKTQEWASREVELACEKEKSSGTPNDSDFGQVGGVITIIG